ncbi:hypothetical protein [Haloferax sp. DFSO52]|uniref:hypothetical protein n=1 Tax=Haloferax sp. DFSO52 TaxID=3388505 RepID=UPI003A85A769
MTTDPFSLSVPGGWRISIETDVDDSSGRVIYESPDEDYRVVITEFARGLALYWWVDIFASAGGEWHRREVGLGDSFRDTDAVAAAAQDALDGLTQRTRSLETLLED